MSNYPGAVDIFAEKTNWSGDPNAAPATARITAADVNNVQDAILAVQDTLGVNPQGTHTDVAARLAALTAPDWTTGAVYVVGQLAANAGTLYRCTTAHTAGVTFDASKFTAIGGGGGGAVSSVVGQTGAVTGTQILADSTVAAALTGKAPTTRAITAGTGLTGGGDLSADRSLAVTYGTTAGTATQGDDTRITGAAQKAANLSDLASAATARTNLGLGSAATMTPATIAADSALTSTYLTVPPARVGPLVAAPEGVSACGDRPGHPAGPPTPVTPAERFSSCPAWAQVRWTGNGRAQRVPCRDNPREGGRGAVGVLVRTSARTRSGTCRGRSGGTGPQRHVPGRTSPSAGAPSPPTGPASGA